MIERCEEAGKEERRMLMRRAGLEDMLQYFGQSGESGEARSDDRTGENTDICLGPGGVKHQSLMPSL
jgi:hypothetical protein